MPRCAVCGGEYAKTMDIRLNGVTSTYDCFECAIHALAPACEHCGCRVIGHGVERGGKMFCCAHCAQQTSARPVQV
jgi:Prokaryotic metallothionein.